MHARSRHRGSSTPARDSAFYRESHRDLLGTLTLRRQSSGSLDAIAVPTSRELGDGLPGLELAAQLAIKTDSLLLVLCSGSARAREVQAFLGGGLGARLICRDLPDRRALFLPMFRSSGNRLSRLYRSADTGTKRNVALALAAVSGWVNILFLDDDMFTGDAKFALDSRSLADALRAMHAVEGMRAVGWPVESFPDNSVVGHARRLSDMKQQTFVGGGALLVRCDRNVAFFPDIFNEDWLFLIATARASSDYRSSIGYGGSVEQLTFDPFRVVRARSEEVGDIIGEGLMNLLEDDGPAFFAEAQSTDYWCRVINGRAALIDQLHATLAGKPRTLELMRACTALSAARDVHRRIDPDEIVRYLTDWQRDLAEWRGYLASLAARQLKRWADPALVLDWLMSAGPPAEKRLSNYHARHVKR